MNYQDLIRIFGAGDAYGTLSSVEEVAGIRLRGGEADYTEAELDARLQRALKVLEETDSAKHAEAAMPADGENQPIR